MIQVVTKDLNVHKRSAADGLMTTMYLAGRTTHVMVVLTKDGVALDRTHEWRLDDIERIEVVGGPAFEPTYIQGVPIVYLP